MLNDLFILCSNGSLIVNMLKYSWNNEWRRGKYTFSNIAKKGLQMHFWVDVYHLGNNLSNPPIYLGHMVTGNWTR